MDKIYLGDIGTIIRLDCGQDVSAATTKEISAKKPDGTVVIWTATVYQSNYVQFTTILGTLDQVGTWTVQAKITDLGGWTGYGESAQFQVRALHD